MSRALVIRMSALGDVVLTEPVARALRSVYDQVDLVTDVRYVPMMTRAGFDRVIAPEEASTPYDLVVDLQGKLKTRSLARRLSSGRRLTLVKRSPGRALLSIVGYDPPIVDRHSVELYLGLLRGIGLDAAPSAPRLERRQSAEGRVIGLAPGARHATKRWAPERFGALADRLAAIYADARFLPVGGEADRPLLDKLTTTSTASFLPATTALDVTGLVDALEGLSLLVTVDSGPAHIAAALGVPTVVLFGPTSPVRWGPLSDSPAPTRTIAPNLDCAPCSNFGGERCPLSGAPHTCMVELEADVVFDAALSALEATR